MFRSGEETSEQPNLSRVVDIVEGNTEYEVRRDFASCSSSHAGNRVAQLMMFLVE